jgi:hypothetical protein
MKESIDIAIAGQLIQHGKLVRRSSDVTDSTQHLGSISPIK